MSHVQQIRSHRRLAYLVVLVLVCLNSSLTARAQDCQDPSGDDYAKAATALGHIQSRYLALYGTTLSWNVTGWSSYPTALELENNSGTSTIRSGKIRDAFTAQVPTLTGGSSHFLNLSSSTNNPFQNDDATPLATGSADILETVTGSCSDTVRDDWRKIRKWSDNITTKLDTQLSAIEFQFSATASKIPYHSSQGSCLRTGSDFWPDSVNDAYGRVQASGPPVTGATDVYFSYFTNSVTISNCNCIVPIYNVDGCQVDVAGASQLGMVDLPALDGQAKIRMRAEFDGTLTGYDSQILALSRNATTRYSYGSLSFSRITPSNPSYVHIYTLGQKLRIFVRVDSFPHLEFEGSSSNNYAGNVIATSAAYGIPGTGGYVGGQSNATGPNPVTCNPVALTTGHKIERAVDLAVAVTGPDFELTREYTSDPTYHSDTGGNIVGTGWSLNTNLYLRASGTDGTTLSLEGFPLSDRLEFTGTGGTWTVAGPSTQTLNRTTVTIDGDTINVVRLEEPGGWTKDFKCNPTISDGEILYLLREADVYGNTRIYQWDTSGVRRLHRVYLNGTPGTTIGTTNVIGKPAEAEIRFTWIAAGLTDQGKLSKVEVVRFDPQTRATTIAQDVSYTYFNSAAGMNASVGNPGDLVQVTRRTLLSGSTYYPEATLYRYHTTGIDAHSPEESTPLHGRDHQLKAVMLPAEVEYAAFRHFKGTTGTPPTDRVSTYASTLLTMTDTASVASSDADESPAALDVEDVFSKRLGYETSGTYRVLTQFSLTGGCACSGEKLGYVYTQNTSPYQKLVTITESKSNGTTYAAYRETKHRLEPLNNSNSTGVYFEMEKREYAAGAATNDAWVTLYTYDSNGQLITEQQPSGLQRWYHYSNNRLDGTGFKLPGQSGNPYWTDKVVYGSTPSIDTPGEPMTRPWLPTRTVRYSVAVQGTGPPSTDPIPNEAEVTAYTYWLHLKTATTGVTIASSDGVSIVDKSSERELNSENGPGGTTHEVEFFDQRGRNTWSRAADGALTHRQFDPSTGVLTMSVANANPDESPTDGNRYVGLTRTAIPGKQSLISSGVELGGKFKKQRGPAGATALRKDGDLTTRYTVDKLGRVTETITPGGKVQGGYAAGVLTQTERIMRVASDRSATNPGVLFYAEVHHPAQDTSGSPTQYSGPITFTVMNAAGQVINSDSTNASNGDLLSRSVTFLNAARQPMRSSVASRVNGSASTVPSGAWDTTEYTYDTLGRLIEQVSPNGTLSTFSYDVRDRVMNAGTGVKGVDAHVTAEYFYDTGLTGATQAFGDSNLTLTVLHPTASGSSSDNREIRKLYDARNRLVSVKNPLPPFTFTTYDDLNRPKSSALYSVAPTDAATPPSDVTKRGKYSETLYSQRGLPYRTRIAINPGISTLTFLQSNTWYDDAGRPAAELNPSGPSTKRVYDGLGRVVLTCVTDHGGDHLLGDSLNYSDTNSLGLPTGEDLGTGTTDDLVFEQTFVTYAHHDEANAGEILFVQTLKRPHDATTTGLLTLSNAVATYLGYVYDSFDRQIHSVDLGTNLTTDSEVLTLGGLQPTSQLGDTDPPSDSKQRITTSRYGPQGLVELSLDPLAHSTRFTYDARNRAVSTVENSSATLTFVWNTDYWDLASGSSAMEEHSRVTTTSYDHGGHKLKQVAFTWLSSSSTSKQTTTYSYDTTSDTSTSGRLISKETLASIDYPHDSGTNLVKMSYNWLGETVEATDQNSTKHAYTLDSLGRVITDEVTNFGTDIDTSIKKIATGYDDFGRRLTVSSKNSSGTIVNQVLFGYTPLGQISLVSQDCDSEISSNALEVSYVYDTVAQSTTSTSTPSNYSRLYQEIYPDGRPYEAMYFTMGSSDGMISRLTGFSQQDGPGLDTEYSYLGLSTVSVVDNITTDVQLDRTFDRGTLKRRSRGHQTGSFAGTFGRYPGFDRFGRVIRQAWLDGTFIGASASPLRPNGVEIFDESYSYDNNSNRLSRTDERWGVKRPIRIEHFDYDGLSRLTRTQQNTIGSTSLFSDYETWSLDTQANWHSFGHDESGDQAISSSETASRTFNAANDLTNSGNTLNYPNGMLRKVNSPSSSGPKTLLTYDAWGRLTKHQLLGDSEVVAVTNSYEYNGLGWRTKQTSYNSSNAVVETRWFAYDASWRVIEEHVYKGSANTLLQEFYGIQGMDDPICRRVRMPIAITSGNTEHPLRWDGNHMESLDKDYYHFTDSQGSTRAMMGSMPHGPVIERVDFDAYGRAFHRFAGSVAFDGNPAVNDDDHGFLKDLRDYTVADSQFDVDCDLNRDGTISDTDLDILDTQLGFAGLEPGAIGASGTDLPWNSFGFCGYVYAPEAARYCVRNRWYDAGPSLAMGRWLQRDPAGYVDGMNLFEYCASGPTGASDPMGLALHPGDAGYFREAYQEQTNLGNTRLAADIFLHDLTDCERKEVEALEAAQIADSLDALANDRLIRLEGSLNIIGNTFTFGASDALGLTNSEVYDQTWGYGAARVSAGVAREAAIQLTGVGAARWIAEGGELASAGMRVKQGVDLYNKGTVLYSGFQGGYQIGQGNFVGGGITVGLSFLGANGFSSKGTVGLDTVSLVAGLERGELAALDRAIAGRTPTVSITAAKEFLRKGDVNVLRQFLSARGGRIGAGASMQEVAALQSRVSSANLQGAKLQLNDAMVAGSAALERATVITRDSRMINRLNEIGVPVQRW